MVSFDIDGDLIRKLADLLRETGLTEVEFADGDRRIRVTRQAAVATVSVAPPPLPVVAAGAAAASGAAPAASQDVSAKPTMTNRGVSFIRVPYNRCGGTDLCQNLAQPRAQPARPFARDPT